MNEEESLGLGFLAFTEEERMHEERRAANIAAVRAYLEAEFPGHKIQDWHDAKGDVHGFRVRERGLADVLVSHEFLDDRETNLVEGLLRGWGVAAEMRRAGKGMVVLVAREGFRSEPERDA